MNRTADMTAKPERPPGVADERLVMLRVVPISLDEANTFVAKHHRHHQPVPGHKFSAAIADDKDVRGVVIVGCPVSRMLDNGWTLEALSASPLAAPKSGSAARTKKGMAKAWRYMLEAEGQQERADK